MAKAKDGDKVRAHYSGYLEDGTQFDSSAGKDPIEFTLGERMMIPGFEAAVLGMSEGDQVSVTIQPEDGYGELDPEMIGTVSRDQLPENLIPEIGMQLQASNHDGSATQVLITAVDDDEVTIDGNHELAGKILKFDLELVKIT